MVTRPIGISAFRFTILSSLRAKQLIAGCIARCPGEHRATTMAQMEVAAGFVLDGDAPLAAAPDDAAAE